MVAITKDDKESHHFGLSPFQLVSFQFQTSELVINLCMDPYYKCHHWAEALKSVVCLLADKIPDNGIFELSSP